MTLVTLAGKAHAEIAPFGRRRARDIKTSRPLSPCLGEKCFGIRPAGVMRREVMTFSWRDAAMAARACRRGHATDAAAVRDVATSGSAEVC